jgi:methylated-DNA-[protein]-cysteine S-methyltransferase
LNFDENVLKLCKKIPKGKVTTYKEIAIMLNCPLAARAVGNALNKNPELIKIPCHRVVCFTGHVGDYVSGRIKKIELLKSEGVEFEDEFIDLDKFGFWFKK